MLTPRQQELLAYCRAHGYYDIPRRTTLRSLAKDLGISSTSLSLVLRRAEARVVAAHLDRSAARSEDGRTSESPGSAGNASPARP